MRSHWYRGKMLGRVGGANFMTRDPAQRRPLYEEIRKLALERFGDEVDDYLAFNARLRSRLLRAGDYDGLMALAKFEAGLRTEASLLELEPDEEGASRSSSSRGSWATTARWRSSATASGCCGCRPPRSPAGSTTPRATPRRTWSATTPTC